jgi:hypothetical protein
MDRRLPAAAGLLALASCARDPTAPAPGADHAATVRRLVADVAFLSSDLLEGRGTPSRGLDIAAQYLEAQLRMMGAATPASASYQQTYRIGGYLPGEATVSVRIDGRVLNPRDYVFINLGRDPARWPASLPLVEAGDGVVFQERNVNDLASIDVKGKAVVARKGAPWKLDPAAVFGPDRAIGKVMEATLRGAEMLVYLSDQLDGGMEAEAQFFTQMKQAGVGFVREPGLKHASALNPILVLRPSAYGSPGRGARIAISIDAKIAESRASNVLGVFPGSDAALRSEWVVLAAHYDHLGSVPSPPGKDGIWNGADDNASGTAGVLELARRFAASPGKRSVLALFTSGEDRGIFGSAHYSVQPEAPMDRVAAMINLDMIGRSAGVVQAIAPTAPKLFEEAVGIGARRRVRVIDDQQPSWRVIYLTDAYHFARAGVPTIHFFTGLHADYHQPSDTIEKIRAEEMARIVEVAAEIARSYAGGAPRAEFRRPAWFVAP